MLSNFANNYIQRAMKKAEGIYYYKNWVICVGRFQSRGSILQMQTLHFGREHI